MDERSYCYLLHGCQTCGLLGATFHVGNRAEGQFPKMYMQLLRGRSPKIRSLLGQVFATFFYSFRRLPKTSCYAIKKPVVMQNTASCYAIKKNRTELK